MGIQSTIQELKQPGKAQGKKFVTFKVGSHLFCTSFGELEEAADGIFILCNSELGTKEEKQKAKSKPSDFLGLFPRGKSNFQFENTQQCSVMLIFAH